MCILYIEEEHSTGLGGCLIKSLSIGLLASARHGLVSRFNQIIIFGRWQQDWWVTESRLLHPCLRRGREIVSPSEMLQHRLIFFPYTTFKTDLGLFDFIGVSGRGMHRSQMSTVVIFTWPARRRSNDVWR